MFVLCRYTVVGRSFFSPNLGQTGQLGYGTEYWRGYYQSLRPTQMGLSLNIGFSSFLDFYIIHTLRLCMLHCNSFTLFVTFLYCTNDDPYVADVSATAFYEPISVTDFVARYLNVNFSRPLSDQDRVKVINSLRF